MDVAVEFFVTVFIQGFAVHLPLWGALAFVLAVVGGAGGGMGLPLLFWHERKQAAFAAGLSTALLAGELFLVGYLLDARRLRRPELDRLLPALADQFPVTRYALGSVASILALALAVALAWGLAAVVVRLSASSAPRAPARPRTSARRPSKGAFFQGALLGAGLLAAFGALARSIPVGPASERLARACLFDGACDPADSKDVPLHALAAIVGVLLAAVWLVEARGGRRRLGAAVSICAMLGLQAAVFGFLSFHIGGLVAFLVPVAFLCLGGVQPLKVRFPGLARHYAHPVPLAHAWPAITPAAPGNPVATPRFESAVDEDKPTLVVVCASGGGLRAAVWTNAVLSELEAQGVVEPRQIALIAGASGGMVGATFWAASLKPPPAEAAPASASPEERFARSHVVTRSTLAALVGTESLSDVAHRLVFHDLPLAFLPVSTSTDRGATLQDTWRSRAGAHGGVVSTFGELLPGERAGWRPTLVYSPMLVEDSRRLLVSNMDLGFLTTTFAPRPAVGGVDPAAFQSCSALEFRRLFPDDFPGYSLFEAARMSASFPFVTPAGVLPTLPRRRVVDAGYYDNFGVAVIAGILDACLYEAPMRTWLEGFRRVLVLQIRDGLEDVASGTPPADDNGTSVSRGVEGLTSPIEAVLHARNAAALFRNDEQLETLAGTFGGFLATETFAFGGRAALSWSLTTEERHGLEAKAKQAVKARAAALADFLGSHHGPACRPDWWWPRPASAEPSTATPASVE